MFRRLLYILVYDIDILFSNIDSLYLFLGFVVLLSFLIWGFKICSRRDFLDQYEYIMMILIWSFFVIPVLIFFLEDITPFIFYSLANLDFRTCHTLSTKSFNYQSVPRFNSLLLPTLYFLLVNAKKLLSELESLAV